MSDADDCDDYEEPVEALVGGASGGSDGVLADLILDMTCATVKLVTLLQETDAAEFKSIEKRLGVLLGVTAQIPKSPRARRRPLGFVVDRATPLRRAPASRTTRSKR